MVTTWFVDVRTWAPESPVWQRALALIPEEEQQQVNKFVFPKDQRLALASRLLQRQLIHSVFHVPWDEIVIARTPEGKPYWQRAASADVPVHWNYNVSHHGTIVAIAAHSQYLVGVDVVQLSERPRRRKNDPSSEHFFRAFKDYFTPVEWNYIRRSSDEDAQFHAFYRLWSLKESYIKAVGIGLGFELLRAEFTSVDDSDVEWTMKLDGQIARAWRFQSLLLPTAAPSEPHWVSVALGPVSEIWNPMKSSIFPVQQLTAVSEFIDEIPSAVQWQEKTLDDLLSV